MVLGFWLEPELVLVLGLLPKPGLLVEADVELVGCQCLGPQPRRPQPTSGLDLVELQTEGWCRRVEQGQPTGRLEVVVRPELDRGDRHTNGELKQPLPEEAS